MKKFVSFIVLIILSLMLTSCNISNIIPTGSTIKTDTLNHISTVVINSNLKVKTETYSQVYGHEIDGPYQGTGSGVIIKSDYKEYYLLTNCHVVYLTDEYLHRYTVEDIYNNTSVATLVAKDEFYDLAILKFTSNQQIDTIPFAEKNPNVGDLVFSIGSPSGKHNIITAGKVLTFQNIENVEYKVIVHDAVIKNGSSGSMLINDNYEIVGLNTWGFLDNDSTEEYVIGGATPVEKIKEFLEKIKFEI